MKMSIRIAGTGSYVPATVLTNADLEKRVDTTDDWITTRTGIRERRIASEAEATSDLACAAAENALEMAGIAPVDLDLVIVATITPDRFFPSTACLLQRKIGASRAVCFDLHAACSGLLYSMQVADSLMRTTPNYRNVLIVGAEKLTTLVDWEDRATCVLFGDGAGAVVLERREDDAGSSCIVGSNLGSDGNYSEILQVPAGGSAIPTTHESINQRLHYMKMEGQEVFKLAVNAMVSSCRELLEQTAIPPDQIRWLIPHQANLRILKAVGSRLAIPDERIYINLDKYGNTSAASIGIVLDEIARSGKVKPGDHLLLTAFGGGLTWGSVMLRW